MNILIFNGALERRPSSTSHSIIQFLQQTLEENGIHSTVFNLAGSAIPLFDFTLSKTPVAVEIMTQQFREADAHIWLTPLYHGSMTGVMKNCLDWLEISAKEPRPYLTDKMVGLISWADGGQALQGINAMDAIAKSLRAWPVPFSVPIVKPLLFDEGNPGQITKAYQQKLQLLIRILISKQISARSLQENDVIL
ncbi:NADPH-dependent FMN reductase [Sphingobacterium spiritivorum]|uniref:NADPH-dependent FMN reductase n=1 Tax=Sphingobacterium spiritivorum TaxID=258 RepID=UPI003DA665F1